MNVGGRSASVRNVILRSIFYLVETENEFVYKIESANSRKSLVVYVCSAYYVVSRGYRYYVFTCVPIRKVEVEGRGGSLGRTVEDVVRVLVVCSDDTERIRTRVFYRSPFYFSVVCGNGDTVVAFPHSVKFAVRFDFDSVYVFTGQFCRIVRIAHPPAHKPFAQLGKIVQYSVVGENGGILFTLVDKSYVKLVRSVGLLYVFRVQRRVARDYVYAEVELLRHFRVFIPPDENVVR